MAANQQSVERFVIKASDIADVIECDRDELLRDNAGDDELADWVREAAVKDCYRTGGGAAPIITVERTA